MNETPEAVAATPRHTSLMEAAVLFKLSKLFTKRPSPARTYKPTPQAVNVVRRVRAAAAKAYDLKPGGRQKVRFRRFMRAAGSPAFQRFGVSV